MRLRTSATLHEDNFQRKGCASFEEGSSKHTFTDFVYEKDLENCFALQAVYCLTGLHEACIPRDLAGLAALRFWALQNCTAWEGSSSRIGSPVMISNMFLN